jgi:hypothetical protein
MEHRQSLSLTHKQNVFITVKLYTAVFIYVPYKQWQTIRFKTSYSGPGAIKIFLNR